LPSTMTEPVCANEGMQIAKSAQQIIDVRGR
jgi:hypothetical protein